MPASDEDTEPGLRAAETFASAAAYSCRRRAAPLATVVARTNTCLASLLPPPPPPTPKVRDAGLLLLLPPSGVATTALRPWVWVWAWVLLSDNPACAWNLNCPTPASGVCELLRVPVRGGRPPAPGDGIPRPPPLGLGEALCPLLSPLTSSVRIAVARGCSRRAAMRASAQVQHDK